jgi:hypothetical protein
VDAARLAVVVVVVVVVLVLESVVVDRWRLVYPPPTTAEILKRFLPSLNIGEV